MIRCYPNTKSKNLAVGTATLNIKLENEDINKTLNEFDNNYVVVDNNKEKEIFDNKVIFGKLMVNVRTSNEIVLTSILGNISKTSTDENYLYLYTNDEIIYKQLTKKENVDILNENLKKFTSLKIKVEFQKKEDEINLKEIIKEKFKKYFIEQGE